MTEPQFVRLGNLSGLVGPLSAANAKDSAFRPGGSDISSLTSQSNNDDLDNRQFSKETTDPGEIPRFSNDETDAPKPKSTSFKNQARSAKLLAMKRTSISQVTVDEEIILMNKLFNLKSTGITYGPRGSVLTVDPNPKKHHFHDHPTMKIHANTNDPNHTLIKGKLKLVQSISYHEGPIWAMKFSPNGHYLASGGQDSKILIWSIAVQPKSKHNTQSSGNGEGNSSGKVNNNSNDYEDNGIDNMPYEESSPYAFDNEDRYSFDEMNANEPLEKSNKSNTTTNSNTMPEFEEEEEEDFVYQQPINSPSTPKGTNSKKLPSPVIPLSNNTTTNNTIYDFLYPEPYRLLEGHTGEITDISWSKSNFLLSASTDKTVRLWHVTRNDCLQYFRHPDIVTCVEFHPIQDRLFITGCFDRRLRVWDIIPDGQVKEWSQAPDTITAICFSPDGNTVVSGLIQGQIYFYEYDGLKYKTQLDCRNYQGKYKKGTKVTGMCFYMKKELAVSTTTTNLMNTTTNMNNNSNSNSSNHSSHDDSLDDHHDHDHIPSNNPNNTTNNPNNTSNNPNNTSNNPHNPHNPSSNTSSGASASSFTQYFPFLPHQQQPQPSLTTTNTTFSQQLLITTNDHRIRLCKLEDYSFRYKYKGLKNSSMQIKASFSDDGQYILCGSEYGAIFCWKTFDNYAKKTFLFTKAHTEVPRNVYYEYFENDLTPLVASNHGNKVSSSHGQGSRPSSLGRTSTTLPNTPLTAAVGTVGMEESHHSSSVPSSLSGGNDLMASYATAYGNNPVIVAIFAPGDAVRRYVKSHHHLLHTTNTTSTPTNTNTNNANSNTNSNSYNNNIIYQLNRLELTNRVIATADSQGNIKIFFRMDV